MEALVLYDSNFGNTKLIAQEIANRLISVANVKYVNDFEEADLKNVGLLIIGSPIIGWRPTEKVLSTLSKLPDLKGVKFATFDTRINVFFHGDAKNKIAKVLKDAGAEEIIESNAFFVKGKEGPLADGELEKAADWALEISRRTIRN